MILEAITMPEIGSYLLKQTPLVFFLFIVLYKMYIHFVKEQETKDKIIKEKDSELKMINRESKEDLQKSFSVLQDVTGTLKVLLDRDDSNKDIQKNVNETLIHIRKVCDEMNNKLK